MVRTSHRSGAEDYDPSTTVATSGALSSAGAALSRLDSVPCVIDVRYVNGVPCRSMVFIESAIFTRQVRELLADEAYAAFQRYLALNPYAGDVIQGTGGLRKMRWSVAGRGKSGGVRVIYFHLDAQSQIRLLLSYRKGIKDDLTAAEKKTLRKLNQDW
jgi:mRNA-degrading endonuclease RelE of RelBE toxin-antitoxin system